MVTTATAKETSDLAVGAGIASTDDPPSQNPDPEQDPDPKAKAKADPNRKAEAEAETGRLFGGCGLGRDEATAGSATVALLAVAASVEVAVVMRAIAVRLTTATGGVTQREEPSPTTGAGGEVGRSATETQQKVTAIITRR